MDWAEVSAIAAAVSTVVLAVSAIIVLLQVRRMRVAQELEVVLRLYDRSTSQAVMDAQAWVRSVMPPDFDYKAFRGRPEDRRRIELLWYHFEFLGVLVAHGFVSPELFFDQEGAFIAGIWDRTQHLITARREEKQDPTYMENFELLQVRFRTWARRQRPKLAPTRTRKVDQYYDNELQAAPTGPGVGAAGAGETGPVLPAEGVELPS